MFCVFVAGTNSFFFGCCLCCCRMRAFCDDDVNKPFGVRYKHYSNTIEVDRSIVRGPAPEGDECKDSFIMP